MKRRLLRRLVGLFALLICLFTFLSLHAQDSATVSQVKSLVGYAENKWPIAATVAAIWGALSELMGLIPNKYLPANGVLDGVWKFLQAVFGSGK